MALAGCGPALENESHRTSAGRVSVVAIGNKRDAAKVRTITDDKSPQRGVFCSNRNKMLDPVFN
jgi:hypothetical protein